MRKVFSSIFILLFATVLKAQPLPQKLKHTVIIDTDCAIDDMRALSLLLARPEIIIKAILLSDGSLTPSDGLLKVSSLLGEFGRKDIPVASGEAKRGINPPWREFNKQIKWGNEPSLYKEGKSAMDCLTDNLRQTDERLILICLGPLTNIGKMIEKSPELLAKVERIIWYNESAKPISGFNYDCDKDAAFKIFKSKVRIDVISNLNKEFAFFDSVMFADCDKSETQLARILSNVHLQPLVLERLKQMHFRLDDDLVALYLTNPELFNINPLLDNPYVRYNQDYSVKAVREAFSDMISGKYVSDHNVVFNRFPVEREMFNYDIRPIIDTAIALYGMDEWKANVMTDEFHGHLGVFSIVGAKMGIRAREIFGVGTDMLEVTTYAGSKPPYSCLTDGIQVSTGATLGMGTIHLAADSIARPKAVFTYKGRSVSITLKKEYLVRVEADINEGILKFGLMDDGYWKLIRRNALKYWVEWDRNKIFDIMETPQTRE